MSHEVKNGSADGPTLEAGGPLARQLSVQLTNEQFERAPPSASTIADLAGLYLEPGGQAARGDLSKRLGNPTALGICCFLYCLTPVSILRRHDGRGHPGARLLSTTALTVQFTVFFLFGGFWLAFGFLNQPIQNIAGAFEATGGANSPEYLQGVGVYTIVWTVIVFFMLIASLRTNAVFVVLFFTLDIAFALLVAAYYAASNASSNVTAIFKAAGAFAFVTCACGYWLALNLLLGSTGFPFQLPVYDLSGFLSGKKTR